LICKKSGIFKKEMELLQKESKNLKEAAGMLIKEYKFSKEDF